MQMVHRLDIGIGGLERTGRNRTALGRLVTGCDASRLVRVFGIRQGYALKPLPQPLIERHDILVFGRLLASFSLGIDVGPQPGDRLPARTVAVVDAPRVDDLAPDLEVALLGDAEIEPTAGLINRSAMAPAAVREADDELETGGLAAQEPQADRDAL